MAISSQKIIKKGNIMKLAVTDLQDIIDILEDTNNQLAEAYSDLTVCYNPGKHAISFQHKTLGTIEELKILHVKFEQNLARIIASQRS